MASHDMGPSRLNHGLTQCRKCHATDREIALALGPNCPVDDLIPEPAPQPAQLTHAHNTVLLQASWFAGYFERQFNRIS